MPRLYAIHTQWIQINCFAFALCSCSSLMWWLNLFTFNQKQAIRVRWCWFCADVGCYYHCGCVCAKKFWLECWLTCYYYSGPNQYFFRDGRQKTNEINWNTRCLWQNYDRIESSYIKANLRQNARNYVVVSILTNTHSLHAEKTCERSKSMIDGN